MAAVATVCGGSESSGSCNTSTAGSNSDSAAHDEREDVILEPLKLLKNTLPAPLQFGPMLLPSDSTSSPLKSTRLAGQLISCFVVGGECRLCLPQLLAMILPNISDTIIQKVYTELQIHTAVATLLQMESLKVSGILPPGTSSCSLIRKSDAERLVSRLLPQSSGRLKNPKLRENAISICHDDFGGCSGLLIPALITADEYCAAIECTECKLLFTGERFVSHTHQNSVKTGSNSGYQQICHWGFDTANWRYYIYLENESVDSAKDDLKQLQLFTNYKQIEAQNRLSALVSSQMQNALKRHSDTKLDGFGGDTVLAKKASKLLPEHDTFVNENISVETASKFSPSALQTTSSSVITSPSVPTKISVLKSVSPQSAAITSSIPTQSQAIPSIANPTTIIGHNSQPSLQTFQNLQLLLNYQNSQNHVTQMPILTLQQELAAKLASLSTIPPALLLQNPSYNPLKGLPSSLNPATSILQSTAIGINPVARAISNTVPANSLSIPALPTVQPQSSSLTVPAPAPAPGPSTSEMSSNDLNIISKLLSGSAQALSSQLNRMEFSPSSSGAVGSLDKLLESNMSINAYTLARAMLDEERTRQQQKQQQLEAEVEKLQLLVEQLKREQILYQNLLISGNVTGLRDVCNLGEKTAIF